MSNLDSNTQGECDTGQCGSGVTLLLRAKDKDLGGFSVRRMLPSQQARQVGPWVFFDHMGPAQFSAGDGINVRPHPHIGIATVTYLFEGEILHRDSLGSTQPIRPGDINLRVAGRGITHSERERPEVTASDHVLHGLQLWLALPEGKEEIEPAFYHYPAGDIPRGEVDGVPVRVMMGQAYGMTSPVLTYSSILYAEAHLQAGQVLALPEAEELAVYVADGELSVGDTTLPEYSLAIMDTGRATELLAVKESRIAILGGDSLSPRYMEWNFVSSSKARLEQAKADWREGRFAKVVDDENEFIPYP